MAENKLARNNQFKIVGTLLAAEPTFGKRKDNGDDYISVKLTILSIINGEENEFQVDLFSSKTTKEGKENQLFISYSKTPELVNRKVEINGELREQKYWSANRNQVVSYQSLSGRFVRGVSPTVADEASFVVSGFIVKTVVERKNKQDEVYRYDLVIGQSNYDATSMNTFTLHIDPNDREILYGVENYGLGETVEVNGILNFTSEQVVVEDENTAFGAPVTKTYTNRISSFYIKGGSLPLEGEVAYTQEDINKLISDYKQKELALVQETKDSNPPVESKPTPRTNQTSLI